MPGNIHDTHINLRLFGSLVSDEESPALLGEIRYSTVNLSDGDGLLVGTNLDHQEPLENAECTRFYSVDAQELSPVHLIKL